MNKFLLSIAFVFFASCISAQEPTFEWAVQFESQGNSNNEGRANAVDNDGNVWTVGNFQESVDFDPGTATNSLSNAGSDDIFIQKMDADGNLLWVGQIGGISIDRGYGIEVDGNNDVYITGIFRDSIDADPGSGIVPLVSATNNDGLIVKLDNNGGFLNAWVNQGYNTFWDLKTDANYNIYTTGTYLDTVDFDPSNNEFNLMSQGGNDVFIQKLDANGNFVWAKSFGGIGSDWGFSLDIDAAENIYVAGRFADTVDFDPGPGTNSIISAGDRDAFIVKLDINGDLVWVKTIGGNEFDYANSLNLDANGDLLLAGAFRDTVSFETSNGPVELFENSSFNSGFIQKMDADGNGLWVKQVAGNGNVATSTILTNSGNEILVNGYFSDTSDFNPGSETFNMFSNDGLDIFLLHLTASGDFIWSGSMGGDGNDFTNKMDISANDELYMTGRFRNVVDFDMTDGVTEFTSGTGDEIFVLKMLFEPLNTSINEVNESNVLLYPNPSNGSFIIDLEKEKVSEIQVFNEQGKLVEKIDAQNEQSFDLNLKSGVYFLQITTDGKSVVKKLLVE